MSNSQENKISELTEDEFLTIMEKEAREWEDNFWNNKNLKKELDIHSPEFLRET